MGSNPQIFRHIQPYSSPDIAHAHCQIITSHRIDLKGRQVAFKHPGRLQLVPVRHPAGRGHTELRPPAPGPVARLESRFRQRIWEGSGRGERGVARTLQRGRGRAGAFKKRERSQPSDTHLCSRGWQTRCGLGVPEQHSLAPPFRSDLGDPLGRDGPLPQPTPARAAPPPRPPRRAPPSPSRQAVIQKSHE